jgi:conjugal transfer pilus assembly protein TraD
MIHQRIQNFFRPAYEARAAAAWGLAVFYSLGLFVVMPISATASLLMLAGSALMLCARAMQVKKLWSFKLALAGKQIELLPSTTFEAARNKLSDKLWLGWGYRWEPKHTQLAYEVLKRNHKEVYPPKWFLRLNGIKEDPRTAKGMQWIQGLDDEKDIVLPFKALEGHTAIMAITGAIKTTLFKLLVYQLASRGDVVIVLDPKGDSDLKKICKEVPAALGQPERFVMFHPAFPTECFRFDAFSAWDRETQVASRIRMIMSSDEDNNFVSFVWMTVTNIVGCMKRIGQRASIVSLLEHVQSQSAAEKLCERVLEQFLSDRIEHFETVIADRIREAESESKKPRSKAPQLASPRLAAMIDFFKNDVEDAHRPREVTGLIAALESNREWFGKMIITLTPTLTKLSTGDLGPLLSPNYEDIDDTRPILNSRKLIDGGYVAYFGLDALSDPSVAAAMAAVTLADMAGTAGEIYNYDIPNAGGKAARRVHVLIDEWGDAVCEPVIQLANKARGAGMTLYLAGQTFADLVVKMGGNIHMARRILGNMNNMIVGATNDADTLNIIADKFGETVIKRASISQGAGQKTEDAGLEYSSNRGTSISEQTAELVPKNLLMALPDLQYFAVVNRAAIYKGRLPVMTLDHPA